MKKDYQASFRLVVLFTDTGTRAYSFCWGMGGENQDYADMDAAPITRLR